MADHFGDVFVQQRLKHRWAALNPELNSRIPIYPYSMINPFALVINQTSVIKDQNLADFLLSKKIRVKLIFAPEHGFRGEADAGAVINNSTDTKNRVANHFHLWQQ